MGLLVEVPPQGQLSYLDLAFIHHLACRGYHNESDVIPASGGAGMKRTLNFSPHPAIPDFLWREINICKHLGVSEFIIIELPQL